MVPPSSVTSSSLHAISAYLLEIHRACHVLPLRAFQELCFERLKSVVAFDSGFLGAGTFQRGTPQAHDAVLHRQPPALMESWERIKHFDVVAFTALSSPNRTHRFESRVAFAEAPLGLEHCLAFSLEHVLCTAMIAERARSYFVLSLYRHELDRPFTEDERSAIEAVVPHVVEAMRQAKLEELRRAARAVPVEDQRAAIVNRAGVILEAEPAFVELLAAVYPDWEGPWLPAPLAALAAAQAHGRRTVGRLVFRLDPRDDLVLVHARRASAVDALTEREHQVARLFARGASAKEIAEQLAIAPNTVRVHLGRVYEKLGVSNKAELASMLLHDDRASDDEGADGDRSDAARPASGGR